MNALTPALTGLALALVPGFESALPRVRVLAALGRLATRQPAAGARRRPGQAGPPAFVLGGTLDYIVACTVACAVVCLAATLAVALAAGPVLGTAAGIGTATLGRLVVTVARRARTRRRAAELLGAVRLMAAELEAGGRPGAAFRTAAAACPEHRAAFHDAAAALERGADPPLAAAALRGLARAWSVAAATGAPLAAVVRRVGDDLAARAEQRHAVRGAVAGAQSSAVLLAALPTLGLLLGVSMGAHPLHVLLGTAGGRLLCLVGVALDSAGVLWTMRLTARAEGG